MPKDVNGDTLKPGDRVQFHGTVRAAPSGDSVDVIVDVPEGEYSPHVTVCGRALLRIPPMRNPKV